METAENISKMSLSQAVDGNKTGQIEQQLNLLGVTLDDLEALYGQLVGKLKPVTLDLPQKESDGTSTPDEYLVPVAETVRQFRRRIEHIDNQIASLKNRIEL